MEEGKHTPGTWEIKARGGKHLDGVEAEIAEAEGCEAYELRELRIVAPAKHTGGFSKNAKTGEWDIPVPATITEVVFDPRHGAAVVAEQDANAQLIAAAPDLLEALETFVADFDSTRDQFWGLPTQVRNSTFEAARKAISKAKGEGSGSPSMGGE